jgi:hypothetical protein
MNLEHAICMTVIEMVVPGASASPQLLLLLLLLLHTQGRPRHWPAAA